MMSIQRQNLTIPAVPTGALLNPARGQFSVIIPQAARNLVLNPSVEKDTVGYASYGSGASLTRIATQQRRGVYALQCTTLGVSQGVYYTTAALVAGTTYVFSVDLKAPAGRGYTIQLFESGILGASVNVRTTGRWQRVATSAYTMVAGIAAQLRVIDASPIDQIPFYTDGWQCEAGRWATTYCDGDLRGLMGNPMDFLWAGTPHASQSIRSAQTRAGGRVMRLDHLGFRVLSYIGLGSILWASSGLPLATGGAQFQDTIPAQSDFSLVGVVSGANSADLGRQMSRVRDVLSYARTAQAQPLILRYEPYDCERPIGDQVDITCVYAPNGGATDNQYQERAALQFSLYMPILASNAAAAVLNGYGTVTNANYVIQRSPEGVWSKLSTGALNGTIYALTFNPANGLIYIGGAYTAGAFNLYLNTYDPVTDTYNVVGGALDDPNNTVRTIAIGPDGSVYIGGDFTLIGGVATTGIAKYNITTGVWSALGTGMNGLVRTIAIGLDGTVYAGGDFTTAGGVASAKIAKWNGSAWSQLAGGAGAAGGDVYALAVGPQGAIYIGGSFTGINSVANTSRIARFDPGTPSINAMGTGMNGTVYALTIALGSGLYVGGGFTTAGGVAAAKAALWNGTLWQPLAAGLDDAVYDFGVDSDGTIIAGGIFNSLGGGALPNMYGLARWNGSAWSYMDVLLPHPSLPVGVQSVLATPDSRLFLGYDKAGTAEASQVITATNGGTGFAAPKILIGGPTSASGRLYSIRNITTGASIWFNLTLSAGEVAALDLDPARMSFMSTFQGNIYGSILDGSNPAGFALQPGANIISLFYGTSTMTATIQWRENLLSLNDAFWGR